VHVDLFMYSVVRKTPKGVWIDYGDRERFVLCGTTKSKKRFAYPTVKEALAGFLSRKGRQLNILHSQANRVEEAIREANNVRVKLQQDGEDDYANKYSRFEFDSGDVYDDLFVHPDNWDVGHKG